MTNQGKWLLKLRLAALLFIAILVIVTVGWIESDGIKAPLLTMMGSSATVIITLRPPRLITIQGIGILVATGVVIAGGMYWLFDAAAPFRGARLTSQPAFFLLAILALYVIVSMLILGGWNIIWNGVKSVVRRLLRR